MDTNKKEEEFATVLSDRFQNAINSLAKCKKDILNDQDELKRLNEINKKLEVELKEARQLEKSHRYHLLSSREMIGNLQETVSQLVYIKSNGKNLQDDIVTKDLTIATMEKERQNMLQKHEENVKELRCTHEKQIEELRSINEKRMQQIQQDSDTQIAQLSCLVEELRCKIKKKETEHREEMNTVVLKYEEKIQRSAAQVAQLQEQLARQEARADVNLDAYRRRSEELEEKLKQSQFKQYLAQRPYPSRFESQVERPYSANRDPYPDTFSVERDTPFEIPKPSPVANLNKPPESNSLQVMDYGKKNPSIQKKDEKERLFTITKRRRLYNEKDFQNFQ